MIRFFNSLGRKLEEFRSITPRVVKMYTCGPTLWNYPHIGNYRTFVFEDLLRRFLEYSGYEVEQIMNLTDVDDRIIKIANEQDLANFRDFTEKFADAFFQDLQFLNVERAHIYPRASEHVPEMTTIIAGLMESGHAYRGDDGSIYFRISSFPAYGKLSGLVLTELKAGARVKVDDYGKDSAQDFALWKAWDAADGRIFWDTSLGKGRPGWHIECSAMSMKYLGDHFDIHTGGVDNMFPHHENEIAQSEAYTGTKFVNYWLHSDFLLIDNEKMAKRLGNVITIKSLRESGTKGSALRLLFLSAHYRAQLNFTEQSLVQAAASLDRLNEFTTRLRAIASSASGRAEDHARVQEIIDLSRSNYLEALENDLDTPSALAVVYELVKKINTLLDSKNCDSDDAKLILDFMVRDFDRIFGVLDPEQIISDLSEKARQLLQRREEARKLKRWSEADSLRNELLTLGVRVEDTPEGQRWKLVRPAEN